MAGLGDYLSAMSRSIGDDEPERPKLAPDIEAIRLRDSLAAFNERHEFRPGMIVRQKPQARGYKTYGDNDQAIVIEMLPVPIIAPVADHGSCYYREPIDMLVGSIEPTTDSSDQFCVYHVDSRRFEPVEGEN